MSAPSFSGLDHVLALLVDLANHAVWSPALGNGRQLLAQLGLNWVGLQSIRGLATGYLVLVGTVVPPSELWGRSQSESVP